MALKISKKKMTIIASLMVIFSFAFVQITVNTANVNAFSCDECDEDDDDCLENCDDEEPCDADCQIEQRYEDCMWGSGNRENIPSVEWACENYAYKTDGIINWCTAWLGSTSDSTDNGTTITTTEPSGNWPIMAWGMCTKPGTTTMSAFSITEDNGSISGCSGGFSRGYWGSPRGCGLTLNIDKFIEGLDPEEDGDYEIYCRDTNIYRRNSSGIDSEGSEQYSPICIRIPAIHYFGQSRVGETWSRIVGKDDYRDEIRQKYYLQPKDKASGREYPKTIEFEHRVIADRLANKEVDWDVYFNYNRVSSSKSNVTVYSGNRFWDGGSSAPDSVYSGRYYRDKQLYYDTVRSVSIGVSSYGVGTDYNLELCEALSVKNINRTRACAEIYTPYNFINTASASLTGSENYVYAGEKTSVRISGSLNPKSNSVVGGTYATTSPSTKMKVAVFTMSASAYNNYIKNKGATVQSSDNICIAFSGLNQCDMTEPNTNNDGGIVPNNNLKNTNNNKNGNSQTENKTYNVYDVNAGNYFCVAAAIYPATSGSDTNLNSEGNGQWYISAPACKIVAKKPTIQVWGGSIYSAGNIDTSVTDKNNLDKILSYRYSITGNNNRTFGSWAELGVVALGTTKGFVSGAALGSTSDGIGGDGNSSNTYCQRVPLTFANASTIPGSVLCNAKGNNSGSLAGSLISGGTNANASSVKISDTSTYRKTLIDYITKQNNNFEEVNTIPSIIDSGQTKIYKTTDNVYLDHSVIYVDNDYDDIKQIPKMIIYTDKDVNIACDVVRVDAIIIAGGTIRTCADSNGNSPDINSSARSHQLIINGIVIAKDFVPGRTYGARAGEYTQVPAEIINYDSSTILWTNAVTDTSKSSTLTITYQQELPPRY